MKKYFYLLLIITSISETITSQVLLSADGPGNTYQLINSAFALPGRNIVESPDCNHSDFGNHIDEVFDEELNKNVFRFHVHVEPDNDRCKKDDRQRNEIKSYEESPENLKANIGEVVEYRWKFKINNTFKPSKSFTHIHQIKAVGGSFASMPMISLTLRKGTPDKLELRYTATKNQKTIKKVNLDLLKGHWVEVTELIKFGDAGSYSIKINKISDNKELFNYSNTSIDTWQNGAKFARPKWGIYRSLKNKQDLQDEIIKYADFSITEKAYLFPNYELKWNKKNTTIKSCPIKKEVILKGLRSGKDTSVEMYDYNGEQISLDNRIKKKVLDVSGFSNGLYFIIYKKGGVVTKTLNCFVN